MSQYLNYSQYQANGGTADVAAFPLLERLARKKLDYWTQNRITDVTCDVELCMTILVDALAESRKDPSETVGSYSNDGVSVSFGKARTEAEIMESVYDQIVEILPVELVSVVIK